MSFVCSHFNSDSIFANSKVGTGWHQEPKTNGMSACWNSHQWLMETQGCGAHCATRWPRRNPSALTTRHWTYKMLYGPTSTTIASPCRRCPMLRLPNRVHSGSCKRSCCPHRWPCDNCDANPTPLASRKLCCKANPACLAKTLLPNQCLLESSCRAANK